MTKAHKPRSGSLAFYPKKRAKRETPFFRAYSRADKGAAEAKALNFLAYKAGMVHVMGKEAHQKSVRYGQEVVVPATVLECPPMKVFGARAYAKEPYGLKALGEIHADKFDKHLKRRMKTLEKKRKKKGGEKEKKAEKKGRTFEDFEKIRERISEIRLIAHTQPALTGIGKKKPAVGEVALSGGVDEQLRYAKEKIGKEISVSEVFREKQFVDVKAVDKGKGFSGVVKRAGVKMHRPKAKKRRIVGSIGPWVPATVMYTVARPGQLGYQTRTEFNKRILSISDDFEAMNPASGFPNYGTLRNGYALVSGSVPGPAKRAIALRGAVRHLGKPGREIASIDYVSSSAGKGPAGEEKAAGEFKAGHKAKETAAKKKGAVLGKAGEREAGAEKKEGKEAEGKKQDKSAGQETVKEAGKKVPGGKPANGDAKAGGKKTVSPAGKSRVSPAGKSRQKKQGK